MNNQELSEMLSGIERLKSNISECDSIIKVLREIQKNYESAVAKPNELLEKLGDLVKSMESSHSELCEKSSLIVDNINDLIVKYTENDREMHSQLMAQCKTQIKELEGIKNSLQDNVNQIKKEIDLMINKINSTKKFTWINLGLGLFSSVMMIALLILNII